MRLTTLSNIFVALLGVVTIIIVATGGWSLRETGLVRSAWHDFERGPAAKTAILVELRAALGHGRITHQMETLASQDPRRLDMQLQGNLARLSANIAAYRTIGLNSREEAAMAVLDDFIAHLASFTKATERMASAEVDTVDLEQRMRRAEESATAALATLRDELRHQRDASTDRVFETITQGNQRMTAASLLAGILLTLMVVALAWFTRFHIVRPVAVLGEAMQALAGGDRSVKIPALDQRTELGEMAQVMAVFKQDVIERHRAETRLQDAIEAISEGFVMYDKRDRLVLCNSTYKQLYEASSDLFVPGAKFEDIIREGAHRGQYPAAQGRVEEFVAERVKLVRSGPVGIEQSLPGGRWLSVSDYQTKDGGFVGIRSDITLRKRAEQQLQDRERQLRLITDKMPAVVAHVDLEERFQFINSTGASWHARSKEEIIGQTIEEIVGAPQRKKIERYVKAAFSGKYAVFDASVAYPDGVTRDVEVSYIPDFSDDGRVVGVFVMVLDMTQRLAAEQAMRGSEARLRGIMERVADGIVTADEQGLIESLNPAAAKIFGYTEDEVRGRNVSLLMPEPYASEHDRYLEIARERGTSGFLGAGPRELAGRRKDGSEFPLELALTDIRVAGRRLFVGVTRDISDRKQAEAALRASEVRFRGVVDNSPSAIFLKDLEGRFLLANKKFEEWYGVSREDVLGMTSHDIYPEENANLYVSFDKTVADSGEAIEEEREITFVDGTVRPIIIAKFPVRDPEGNLVGVGTFNTDLSQQRDAERQLRQAQKMDALGQLTGGIAHDFNNLLMIIGGHARLAMGSLDNHGDAETSLKKVLRATDQATSLTRQLLTFSRRQITEKRIFNVAKVLQEIEELLPSTLGEKIELALEIEDEGACVKTDAGEFNQAILNLAINARDAMPSGGKVALGQRLVHFDEAAIDEHPDLTPGTYVEVYVRDEGEGIQPELLSRILEPFFSTKETGKGTGLGLSMVYGFAKQSGGDLGIASAVGSGTTVRILLPAADGQPSDQLSGVEDLHYGNGETVLLVEDNEALRDLVNGMLKGLGYEVLMAENGIDALEVDESHDDPIDLLLSDVVMPALDGFELAEMIKVTRPDIKMVFMSGYPDRDRSQAAVPDGCAFLQKPVNPEVLARTVWQQLSGLPAPDGSSPH